MELPSQLVVDSHITLQALEEKDAPKLFRLTDRNRARLKQWLPWLDDVKTVNDTAGFLQQSQKEFAEKKSLNMAVLFRGQLAGVLGLHHIDWVNSKTSIGYWLGGEFEGRGIMVRSCRALIDYLFTELKLNRVEIRTAPKNRKSLRIPEKLGFEKEGTLREAEKLYGEYVDHVIYSMLEKDWEKWRGRFPNE